MWILKQCTQRSHFYKHPNVYIYIYTYANETKFYVGSTGLTFKNRYTKHKHSFRHEKNSNATTLSQYIWKLKNNKLTSKLNGKFYQEQKINTI